MKRFDSYTKRLARFALGSLLCGLPLVAGCGQQTALSISIMVPPNDDPFTAASSVVFTLQGSTIMSQQEMSAVSGGHFQVSLEIEKPPHDQWVYLTVEAHDSAGKTVGRGQTPLFELPQSDTTITVYVGRPGQVTATSVSLPDETGSQGSPVGRKFLAGASLRGRKVSPGPEPGFGALIACGLSDSLQPLAHAWRYNPIVHQFIDGGTLAMPRHGAVLVPFADDTNSQQAILWGGADGSNNLITGAEKYDPNVTDVSLLWATPDAGFADPGAPGAYAPAVAEVGDNIFLFSGGGSQPMGGTAVNQAVIAQRAMGMGMDTTTHLGVSRVGTGSGPMMAARKEHSSSPITISEGSGALLFGGLDFADLATKPVAEVFLINKNAFQTLDLMPTPPASRRGQVAVTLPSGKVLIAGGYQEDNMGQKMVLASALLIDAQNKTFEVRDTFLRTPRYAATISLMPQEVVICGGFDMHDTPLATCELFSRDDVNTRIGEPITLPHPRAGHLALPLETNQLLLVGGIGIGPKTVPEIDIYTGN